jgi:hypothetical protein
MLSYSPSTTLLCQEIQLEPWRDALESSPKEENAVVSPWVNFGSQIQGKRSLRTRSNVTHNAPLCLQIFALHPSIHISAPLVQITCGVEEEGSPMDLVRRDTLIEVLLGLLSLDARSC